MMVFLCGYRWCLEPTLATIGKEKVAVPKLFYKIVLSKSEKQDDRVLIPKKVTHLYINLWYR
jgi:DNA/RNA endonuclease G (NUC1)